MIEFPDTPEELREAGFFTPRADSYVCGLCFSNGKDIQQCRIEPGAWALGEMPKSWEPDVPHRTAHIACVYSMVVEIFLDTGIVISLRRTPQTVEDRERARVARSACPRTSSGLADSVDVSAAG